MRSFSQKPLAPRQRVRNAAIQRDAHAALTPAVYTLAKAKSVQDALSFVIEVLPEAVYPALLSHMSQRPSLFLPEVLEGVKGYIGASAVSREAQALFVRTSDAGFAPTLPHVSSPSPVSCL